MTLLYKSLQSQHLISCVCIGWLDGLCFQLPRNVWGDEKLPPPPPTSQSQPIQYIDEPLML